jgi:rhomboid family GlyGly-CTERM serine protease
MAKRQLPFLTISLLAILIGLHWLVPDKTLLYFSAADIARGETWRIVTGHLMHADLQHLLWNGLGLAVLGTLIEYRSRNVLWVTLGVGIASVSALLLSPFSQLEYYCGLSGVLNTLLLVALWLEWTFTRSWLVIIMAGGSIAKVVIEVSQGTSIMTHISWPPYAWSHVAGLIGGLLIIQGMNFVSNHQTLPRATLMASPLTPLDSSEARNAIISPTSPGVATRPGGYSAARSSQT